jgi:hypothetical protein
MVLMIVRPTAQIDASIPSPLSSYLKWVPASSDPSGFCGVPEADLRERER